jgi:hypothetical protein
MVTTPLLLLVKEAPKKYPSNTLMLLNFSFKGAYEELPLFVMVNPVDVPSLKSNVAVDGVAYATILIIPKRQI